MVTRLGFENEVFQSGSFQILNPDGSHAIQDSDQEEVKTAKKMVKGEEESKGGELERGQIRKVNPDSDSILNSDAEQSSFAAAQ